MCVCPPRSPGLGVQRTGLRTCRPPLSPSWVRDLSRAAAGRDMGSPKGLLGGPGNAGFSGGKGVKLPTGPGSGPVREGQGGRRVTVLGQLPSSTHDSGALSLSSGPDTGPSGGRTQPHRQDRPVLGKPVTPQSPRGRLLPAAGCGCRLPLVPRLGEQDGTSESTRILPTSAGNTLMLLPQ